MDNIQRFKNSEFGTLNVFMINGKEYFLATACAKILGYQNPQKAIRDHCKGVNETFAATNGGNQVIKIIPEGDLYRLIIRSKLPAAEKFERWVFNEVLPSIRKHGAYDNLDIQSVIIETVTSATTEIIKQLMPMLIENKQDNCDTEVVVFKRQRRKSPSIIEKLDEELRTTVDNMICSPKFTYKDIVEMLAEEGIHITQTSVWRYAKRYF